MQETKDYGSTSAPGSPSEDAKPSGVHRMHVTLFTCFLCLLVTAEGYDFGVLNGAMVRMKDELKISTLHISLIVTVTPLFVMPGSLLGGALADACGRRASLGLCCLVLIVGPIAMALSSSVGLLLATRAIVGLGIGMGIVIVSMYIAELAPTEMRGRLLMLEDVFLNVGMVLGYLANFLLNGIHNDWRWMLGLGGALPLVVLVVVCLPQMPESPRWLVAKGRGVEAEKVLCIFASQDEVSLAMQTMTKQLDDKQDFVTWQQVLCSWHDGKIRRMLLAGLTVGISQMACGYLVMAYYSSTALKSTMGEQAAFLATVIMGTVKCLVALMTLAVLERVGRRPLLMASASICGLACAWLAIAFANDIGPYAQAFGFSAFMAGFSLGLGPIGFLYVSEVFVTRWRSKALGFVIFVSRIMGVTTTFSFPLLLEGIGASACFGILAGANVILVSLLGVFVVETHGKTLERMEDIFDLPMKSDEKPVA